LSRQNLLLAALAAILLAAGGLGFYFYQQSRQEGGASAPAQEAGTAAPAAPAKAGGPLPAPIFLVLDKSAVLRFSKAGQDIARQLQPVVTQAQNSIQGQRQSLERQAEALRQDTSLSEDERQKRQAALETKAQALQNDAARRQQQLQTAMARANEPLSKAVGEIVPAIVKQRGANMVLDRAAVAQADPAFDITQDVIAQLDARLPSVKVDLNPPLAAGK
jgi:Skp family chaperone for outer membrane proteins